MKFNNFRIGSRLAIGFATILGLLCVLGATTVWQMSHVYDGTLELANDWLPSIEAAGSIQSLASNVRRTTLRALLTTNSRDQQTQHIENEASIKKLISVLESYSKLVSSPEEQRIYDQIKVTWAAYAIADAKIWDLLDKGDQGLDEARALSNQSGAEIFGHLMRLVEADVELNDTGSVKEVANAAANYHSAVVTSSVLIVVAILAGIGIGYVITISITAPITRAVGIARSVASGNLTTHFEVSGKDETAQLLRAMKDMNQRLGELVGKVRGSSDSIATCSAQIAAGNADLSQRTEEQAASLEQTAASMEELTATVRQNSENALHGNSIAARASETAIQAGEMVVRVVETMSQISRSSEQVTQIIAVIEGIAFQTNILALNAAVEAARAGDQGRGFAVVAGEVRTLAKRSATAAKEIKELINESVQHVVNGSKLVEHAGDTMNEVVRSVKGVTGLISEISAASDEQHIGIEQVNQAVREMDKVTQQNAALVEEASAAAQSMAAQSKALRNLVLWFKISETSSALSDGSEPLLNNETTDKKKDHALTSEKHPRAYTVSMEPTSEWRSI